MSSYVCCYYYVTKTTWCKTFSKITFFLIFKPGVIQYEAVIDLPQDFFETEIRKRQNQDRSQQIANLISRVFNKKLA